MLSRHLNSVQLQVSEYILGGLDTPYVILVIQIAILFLVSLLHL